MMPYMKRKQTLEIAQYGLEINFERKHYQVIKFIQSHVRILIFHRWAFGIFNPLMPERSPFDE